MPLTARHALKWATYEHCRTSLDVLLVFGNLDRGGTATLIGEGPSPEAETVSADMRTAWTGFATHGDPGWPAYDTTQRLTRLFDTPSAVTAYPEETSRLIWQGHTFSALPLIDSDGADGSARVTSGQIH